MTARRQRSARPTEPRHYGGLMSLTRCTDVSVADWLAFSDLPWAQLVSFGPAGFAAQARLRFLPDPRYAGQGENEAEPGAENLPESEQLPLAVGILTSRSHTPTELYFGFWEGNGARAFSGATLDLPNRSYFLFRGGATALAEADPFGTEDQEGVSPALHRRGATPLPALIWPADHAWFIAKDVDPHWAGIGGSVEMIQQLMADPRLDVVIADPAAPQPGYR